MSRVHRAAWFAAVALPMLLAVPAPTRAHCDGIDGPVVKAARQALKTGDVKLVLVWVQKNDERDIARAFRHALAVRKLGDAARELADTFFFETLVRTHRAGEGAPFVGLAPPGRDPGPAVTVADRALETGDPKPLLELLDGALRSGLHGQFTRTLAAKGYDRGDVEAGRRFVASYVAFVHYAERLYDDAVRAPDGHGAEPEPAAAHRAH